MVPFRRSGLPSTRSWTRLDPSLPKDGQSLNYNLALPSPYCELRCTEAIDNIQHIFRIDGTFSFVLRLTDGRALNPTHQLNWRRQSQGA
eukprot:scaffold625678_cov15-Prasinocladus_malaysianus.AAC.1